MRAGDKTDYAASSLWGFLAGGGPPELEEDEALPSDSASTAPAGSLAGMHHEHTLSNSAESGNNSPRSFHSL